MLHPSYKELFQKINESKEEDQPEMTSRYTLVLTAAKRSRQIRSGSERVPYSCIGRDGDGYVAAVAMTPDFGKEIILTINAIDGSVIDRELGY